MLSLFGNEMRSLILGIVLPVVLAATLPFNASRAELTRPHKADPWRFLLMSDVSIAEKYIMLRPENVIGVERDINRLKTIKEVFGGELVLIPGDTNTGRWDRDRFIQRFDYVYGAQASMEARIKLAGQKSYSGLLDVFRQGGYETVLVAIGDHELGDDRWPLGSAKSRHVDVFRDIFAQTINYEADGETFKYRTAIGSAPARPLGTKYAGTSFAVVHKNALFITLDPFRHVGSLWRLGPQGSVDGNIVGKHLDWLEHVLSNAQQMDEIHHIFVQSHLPLLHPIKRWRSSGMSMTKGETSRFLTTLRHYEVDILFAGEFHANTILKDPHSNLLQVVTNGAQLRHFQTIDVGNSDIRITSLRSREFGEKDGNFETLGSLHIDKSGQKTSFDAFGDLALIDPKHSLIFFDFEELSAFESVTLSKEISEEHLTIGGAKLDRHLSNQGQFRSDYYALAHGVNLTDGPTGKAGKFAPHSHLVVTGMGPQHPDRGVVYELDFKTNADGHQTIVSLAPIWSNTPKRLLNLHMDRGQLILYISPYNGLKVQGAALNDGDWHRVKVSKSKATTRPSQIVIEVDGQRAEVERFGLDKAFTINRSSVLSIGGIGYGHKAIKKMKHGEFVGFIDNFQLWVPD